MDGDFGKNDLIVSQKSSKLREKPPRLELL